mgnify:CR=1 FL=1
MISTPTDTICFAYPTLLRPGMESGSFYHPEPLITTNDITHEGKYTLIVTAGIILPVGKIVKTRVEIFYNGETVTSDGSSGTADGYMESPMISVTDDMRVVYLSSMFVKNVSFPGIGKYTIKIDLIAEYPEKIKDKSILSHESYFYVSSVGGEKDGANV